MAIGRGSKWVVSAGGLVGLFLVAGTDLAHGQESVAVLLVHNVGVEAAVWTGERGSAGFARQGCVAGG